MNPLRRPRTSRPGAFSLLELLIAFAVLVLAVGTLLTALSSNRYQIQKADVLITGRLLARAILGLVHHRHRLEDPRFCTLQSPPREILDRARAGDWKIPFQVLSHPRSPVFAAGGLAPFLSGPDGLLIPEGLTAGDEMEFWKRFSFEVRVSFDLRRDRTGAGVPVDADGDGRGEIDLARVEVEIFHDPSGTGLPGESVCLLSTLLASQDKSPGVGVLGRP